MTRSADLLWRNLQLLVLLTLLAGVVRFTTYFIHEPLWQLVYAFGIPLRPMHYLPNPIWTALQAPIHLALFAAAIFLARATVEGSPLTGRMLFRHSMAGILPGLAYVLPAYGASVVLAEVAVTILGARWLAPFAIVLGILLVIRIQVRVWPVLPAITSEGIGFAGALQRSEALISANWTRVLVILLLLAAVSFVYFYLSGRMFLFLVGLFAGTSLPELLHWAVNAVLQMLGGFLELLPTCFYGLAAAVTYYDLRNRHLPPAVGGVSD